MNALALALKGGHKVLPISTQPVLTHKICGADNSFVLRDWSDDTTPLPGVKWCLPELRKQDLKGSLKMWQIGFTDATQNETFVELPNKSISKDGHIITWHGHVHGSIQIELSKVIPLSKSMEEQALQDAKQKYTLKLRKGYLPPGSNASAQITVMSGEFYDIDNPIRLKFPVAQETKMDGIRSWIQVIGDVIQAFSRGNIPMLTINHLLVECKVFLTFLPPGSAIDCELFHHLLSFEEITSIGRTVNEVHPLMPMLELYIFDVYLPSNPPFEERRRMLGEAIRKYREKALDWIGVDEFGGRVDEIADYRDKDDILSGVPQTPKTTKLFLTESHQVHSNDEIVDLHRSYVQRGYEGSMIKRQANGALPGSVDYRMSTYLFGKGTRILKLKDKLTAEATCVEVNGAKGREKGCAVLTLQMDNGKRFSVRMKGSLERRRELLRHPELVLHKPVTYEYQNLTVHGIPRFPVGVEIRDYEPGYPFPLAPKVPTRNTNPKKRAKGAKLPSIHKVD